MGGRKAEKSMDFLKIRDAEGRIVTFLVFLEISLCKSTRGFESSEQKNNRCMLFKEKSIYLLLFSPTFDIIYT